LSWFFMGPAQQSPEAEHTGRGSAMDEKPKAETVPPVLLGRSPSLKPYADAIPAVTCRPATDARP
jgi:hypothetical protein